MKKEKIIDNTSASIANLVPAFTGLTGNIYIAAAGALVAPIIEAGIVEMSNWVLGKLQRKKVVVSANLTCENITNRLINKNQLRKDNFFRLQQDQVLEEKVSSASKVFEGSLLKAKEEYDSKKIPYISFLTSNIFFNPNIDESKAFVFLEILGKLSYRQLCALSLFNQRHILPIGRWETQLKDIRHLQDYYDIAYEITSLKDMLLIEQDFQGQGFGIPNYRISALGKDLVLAANLHTIASQDIALLENKVNYITSSMR